MKPIWRRREPSVGSRDWLSLEAVGIEPGRGEARMLVK